MKIITSKFVQYLSLTKSVTNINISKMIKHYMSDILTKARNLVKIVK